MYRVLALLWLPTQLIMAGIAAVAIIAIAVEHASIWVNYMKQHLHLPPFHGSCRQCMCMTVIKCPVLDDLTLLAITATVLWNQAFQV